VGADERTLHPFKYGDLRIREISVTLREHFAQELPVLIRRIMLPS
jgi:hypothetical protein